VEFADGLIGRMRRECWDQEIIQSETTEGDNDKNQ
jgi:hypothetical protein